MLSFPWLGVGFGQFTVHSHFPLFCVATVFTFMTNEGGGWGRELSGRVEIG
jgi:hypothetical protein